MTMNAAVIPREADAYNAAFQKRAVIPTGAKRSGGISRIAPGAKAEVGGLVSWPLLIATRWAPPASARGCERFLHSASLRSE